MALGTLSRRVGWVYVHRKRKIFWGRRRRNISSRLPAHIFLSNILEPILPECVLRLFPVSIKNGSKMMFLDLPSRKVHSMGHKIPCPPRTKPTYIRDVHDDLWRLTPRNRFKKYPKPPVDIKKSRIPLPKLAEFTKATLHYEKKPPHRIPLLSIMAESVQTLDELADMKTSGNNNLRAGHSPGEYSISSCKRGKSPSAGNGIIN